MPAEQDRKVPFFIPLQMDPLPALAHSDLRPPWCFVHHSSARLDRRLHLFLRQAVPSYREYRERAQEEVRVWCEVFPSSYDLPS